MSTNTQKSEIVEFVRSFYTQLGSVPSVSSILNQFNLSRAKFYRLFPSKLAELCTLAGVPVPESRIQAVKQALDGRKVLKQKEGSLTVTSPGEITEKVKTLVRSGALIEQPIFNFEQYFSALFPGVDMQAAIKAANCKIEEGKVKFMDRNSYL
jgi:hypothetical protein